MSNNYSSRWGEVSRRQNYRNPFISASCLFAALQVRAASCVNVSGTCAKIDTRLTQARSRHVPAPVIKKVPRPIDPKGLGAPSARLCAAGCGGGRM